MPKIAIVSDSHDNEPNIKKFVAFCQQQKIDFVIHCGDVTNDKSKKLFQDNIKTVIFVNGNADINKKTSTFKKQVETDDHFIESTIDKLHIAACHTKSKALNLQKTKKYDYIFYGHTHLPWQEKIDKTELINPGTLAGMFTPPTFAVLDTKNKTLKLILVNQLPNI